MNSDNVVDPRQIVDAPANQEADAFRLWASKYANSHVNLATKPEQFESAREALQKWRKIFCFSIANLKDFSLSNLVSYGQINTLDQYFFTQLYDCNRQMGRWRPSTVGSIWTRTTNDPTNFWVE